MVTTYSVDASGATINKFTIFQNFHNRGRYKTGDSLAVNGTVTGNNVVAKNIMDGMPKDQPPRPRIVASISATQ